MTYLITARDSAEARSIVSETRTTDRSIADLVVAHLEARGFVVVVLAEL